MKFYDLHVQSNLSGGENSIEDIARFAEKLGYSGIAICDNYQGIEKLNELKKMIKEVKTPVELIPGVVIQAKDKNELKTALNKVREKVVIVIVHGGSYPINRVACEDSRVDILAHPELGRADSGLDKACLNLARENNVSIQINFREILYSFRKPRSYIFNHITKNIKLCNEYKTPMVSCSGAQNVWGMRGPRELVSIANVLGLELGRAFASVTSIPQQIVESNKKILKGEKITKGVERVE